MNAFCFIFVELARDDVRLVIFEPQTMQQRDQSRAAFINEAEFLLDPGADLACRTRQRRADPRLQIVFLLGRSDSLRSRPHRSWSGLRSRVARKACASRGSCRRPTTTHRRLADSSTHRPKAPRRSRVASPDRRRPIARQRDQRVAIFFAEEAASNSSEHRNPPTRKIQEISTETSMRFGVYCGGFHTHPTKFVVLGRAGKWPSRLPCKQIRRGLFR